MTALRIDPRAARRAARRLAAVAALCGPAALAPARARAQGTLSGQGFGYPAGQLSTRALGTGGALAEFDPVSPVNPAALLDFTRAFAAIQYDPEYRRLTAGGVSQSNTIARFPLVAAGGPFARRRGMFSVSATTLLDRTFSTTVQRPVNFTGDTATVLVNDRIESNGSIADVRFAVAYFVSRRLRVGLAGHLMSGENRLVSARQFAGLDTARYRGGSDSTTVDFTGTAATLGAEYAPVRGVRLAGSYRHGGSMAIKTGDTTLARAGAPGRLGVALRVDRVAGATFAVSYARTTWSRMQALGSPDLRANDANEFAAGVEAAGPRLGDVPLLLRLGARQRDLPFGVAVGAPGAGGNAAVRERLYGGGAGVPLAGGRALIDLTVQRAARQALNAPPPPAAGTPGLGDVRENAWLVSIGFTVRP